MCIKKVFWLKQKIEFLVKGFIIKLTINYCDWYKMIKHFKKLFEIFTL